MEIKIELEKWISDNQGLWRPGTLRNKVHRIERFVQYMDGRDVTAETVGDYFREMLKVYKPSTYHGHLQSLRSAFKSIGRSDLMNGVKSFRYSCTPARYFQKHQMERIKAYLLKEDPECWLFCEFIYYTFIRPGELRLLKVSDINFEDQKICVRAEISKNKKQQYVTIPEAFRASVEPLRYRAGNEYVFGRVKDRTLLRGECTMRQKFGRCLKALKFEKGYQLYGMKSTGAVYAVRAGINLKDLQIQLRHHSLEMVDLYIRQLGVWDLKNLEAKFPAI